MISFNDFSKIELKIGTVLEVEDVEGSEKLIKLMINLGEDQPRQILAGVKQWYKAEDFTVKQVIIVANLVPRMMMGLESQGMILATDADKPVMLKPSKKVPNGIKVR